MRISNDKGGAGHRGGALVQSHQDKTGCVRPIHKLCPNVRSLGAYGKLPIDLLPGDVAESNLICRNGICLRRNCKLDIRLVGGFTTTLKSVHRFLRISIDDSIRRRFVGKNDLIQRPVRVVVNQGFDSRIFRIVIYQLNEVLRHNTKPHIHWQDGKTGLHGLIALGLRSHGSGQTHNATR